MTFMLFIPIILTVLPALIYKVVMLFFNKKSTTSHYLWTFIMMIYVYLVFSVTGIGSIGEMISKGGLIATLHQANISLIPFQSEGVFTYIMNVIMFMPLGFLLPYIWRNFRNPIKIALTGLVFSMLIEFSQLPTNRLVDIDDLMMNVLGAIFGFVVWKLIGRYFFNRKEEKRTVSLGNLEPVIYILLAWACNFLLYNWEWFV